MSGARVFATGAHKDLGRKGLGSGKSELCCHGLGPTHRAVYDDIPRLILAKREAVYVVRSILRVD
jgi:hypothetical protein